MNTDTAQLLGQIVLIALGPILAKRGISLGSADVDHVLGTASFLIGVIWKFRHWNATPSTPPSGGNGISIPITRVAPVVALAAALFFMGCVPLAPGADPIVVRVEQTETVAKSTFDLALNVDNSNRAFFATNAPAYHSFCEWLREPQTVEETNTLPRAAALLVSLDDVKLSYKASRASSNDVFTALATVTSAVNQANAWLTTVTNQPTR